MARKPTNPFVYRKYAKRADGSRYVIHWEIKTDGIHMHFVEGHDQHADHQVYEVKRGDTTRVLNWDRHAGWSFDGNRLAARHWGEACREVMAA